MNEGYHAHWRRLYKKSPPFPVCFLFAVLFCDFFPFTYEGIFLFLKNLKKATGDPLELRLTSSLHYGPLIQTHSMYNNSESELQASMMHTVWFITYQPPKWQYLWNYKLYVQKSDHVSNNATLLQKDKNIKKTSNRAVILFFLQRNTKNYVSLKQTYFSLF